MDKISKRTQVLIAIREFELTNDRGIGFNELLEYLPHLKRSEISLSLDMLDDRFLIHQLDAKSVLIDGMWRKLITTREFSRPFIDDTIPKIKDESNYLTFEEKLDVILSDPDLEEKLEKMYGKLSIISEEELKREFTI